MITLKSSRELDGMERAGALLASIHEQLRDYIQVGITTADIDAFVEDKIRQAGAIPEQIGYEGYEFATCTSVNDEICHGFPDKNTILKSGDLVGVDTVLSLDGYMADSCWSYVVGQSNEELDHLMAVTKKAMYLGIEQAVVGNRIGDIGHAIQEYVESEGLSVVKEFVGHGIQPTMHEDPSVPHYGNAGRGQRLREGMTITIEPMVNTGAWQSKMDDNGWTARTIDGGLSCQFEHTLAITKEGPRIFTKQKD
ncbi:type I methionyl aminopeptidase [Aerococcus kribbianus]|uniref:Methionine aminopeptidase n=1 Tax=Aerococcus kribbianus TaxID=2999064 RepID=A0A9X3JGI5_9LACT|nr:MULTISPECIES: type I methionyl aminopeptidase [unclassified Aerococcus]MCZ0717291.1 type I methionyl aminopeptidase [Aerococcus sp. YH-aer221]MCZ0725579.1 type I methionyl aminopeptidase [Aerococcus sp. YH-aer222]